MLCNSGEVNDQTQEGALAWKDRFCPDFARDDVVQTSGVRDSMSSARCFS